MSGTRPILHQVHPGERDGNAVDIYANQLRLGSTLHDFTIIFGATDDQGRGQIGSRDLATVRLAPALAKILQMHLRAAVEAYEKKVGPIGISARAEGDMERVRETLEKAYSDQMRA